MIQAIQAAPSVGQVTTAQATAPAKAVQTTAPVQAFSSDAVQVRSKNFSDEEALAALSALRANFGDIRKSQVFSSPKIDNNEALSRIKDGKDIYITIKSAGDRHVYFDSLNELMLLDDLEGRMGDHGVAKPEFRLPLLFARNQKLESYNSNNDDNPKIDPYTAYDYLKRDWRIVINGKEVKPKDLVSHVINQGWTSGADPGLAVKGQFAKLPAGGWKLNGQDVSRDLAYMAWVSGDKRLSLDGAAVNDAKDFAALLNLVANEPNNAVDADLRARLTGLQLNQFSSPVGNYYSVYKHLSSARALTYAGNTLHNLSELEVYDALAGSLKPTSLLPAEQYDALRYLSADKGLSVGNAFAAWQNLTAGQRVSYTFNGGPTGEPISFGAGSMSEIVQLKAKVVEQRQRDQFRPELAQAKQIVAERAPQLKDSLQQNLERTRTAVERARQDVPLQEGKLAEARQDYDRIRPIYDQAVSAVQEAERNYQSAERRYNSDKRSYEWEQDKFQRIERDYYSAQRGYESSLNQARRFDDQARQEDSLATSDPTNAAAHKQKADSYRSQATNARNQAQRYQQDMNRLRFDMDRQRWEVQRTEREMERSRQIFWDARSNLDSKKNILQQQQSQLDEASNRMRQAENQLRIARQTIADGDVIERVSLEAGQQVQNLQSGMGRLKSYKDFPDERQGLQNATAGLSQQLQDDTYTRVHGNSLAGRIPPLQTLLNNMDKPAK
ncbi:MAG TPA: hypothetical protein V6D23_21655 [Candidatus Obscuribacterales bacterium]